MPSVEALITGLGPKCPPLEQLLTLLPTQAQLETMSSPIPALGRYHGSVEFLSDVTSQKVVGLVRFRVMIDYLIALSQLMDQYDGKYRNRKIVSGLTKEDIINLRSVGTTLSDIVRAEAIEVCTEHDTAAAAAWLKIQIASRFPRMESFIEGIAFANTSEDTMSSVFGLIGNSMVYGHVLPKLIDLMEALISYARMLDGDEEKPQPIAGETHQQVAEPQTPGKRIYTMLEAIDWQIQRLVWPNGGFIGFSGRLGGATGNMTTHHAAYPDIDWRAFAMSYIQGYNLTYEDATFQASTYTVEATILTTLGNIMSMLKKLCEDLLAMAAAPSQELLKRKVAGTTGSSVMLKVNMWGTEGAIKMFEDARVMLFHYAQSLPDYPREGNMGRSYLMRNLGNVMMPVFIGLDRIKKELIGNMTTRGTMLSVANTERYLNMYPTLAASSIQTVLKRERIAGDAYRQIERIAINPDGSSASAKQFADGLEQVMDENKLSEEIRTELRNLINPANNIGDAASLVQHGMENLTWQIAAYRQMLVPYATPLIPDNVPIE